MMNQAQRLELVTKGTVEIIQPAELQRVLEQKKKPRAYWGFECSGKQARQLDCPD
jgi:tyrosyl-tRNA synthetase